MPRGKVLTPIPVKLTWEELTYTVAPTGGAGARTKRQPRTVVHPCSGTILPREAVAIMGPSGAGQVLPGLHWHADQAPVPENSQGLLAPLLHRMMWPAMQASGHAALLKQA